MVKINRLKEVLKDKKVSNRTISTLVDKAEGTVSKWCNNHHQPSLEDLDKISEFLHVNRQLLLNENSWTDNEIPPYLISKSKIPKEGL